MKENSDLSLLSLMAWQTGGALQMETEVQAHSMKIIWKQEVLIGPKESSNIPRKRISIKKIV